MTPPEDPVAGDDAAAGPAAVLPCLTVLAKRADFLRAAAARRQGTPGFLLQARRREDHEPPGVRVGFTCSKKVGNAVMRNRAKRRLRALAREVLGPKAMPGWDYVIVARPEATVTRPYADLCADLEQALKSVHRGKA